MMKSRIYLYVMIIFSMVLSTLYAEIVVADDLNITKGLSITGTNGFLIQSSSTSTLAPTWATWSDQVTIFAWFPNKNALRIGSFAPDDEYTETINSLQPSNMGVNSIAINGGLASGERSIAIGGCAYGTNSITLIGGTAYGSNNLAISGTVGWESYYEDEARYSFAQGTSYAEGSYTAVFGKSSSGYESICAFAAGESFADSSYAVSFGKATVGRGGRSIYAFGAGDSFVSDESPFAFAFGTSFIDTDSQFAVAMGNNAQVFAPNAVAIGQSLLNFSPGSFVVGRLNQPAMTATTEMTPLSSAFEVGIGVITSSTSTTHTASFFDTIDVYEVSGTRANAITTLQNGKTTLNNRYWISAQPTVIPSETLTIAGTAQDATSGGIALDVQGHAILRGNVTMEQPQGDILMGQFGRQGE